MHHKITFMSELFLPDLRLTFAFTGFDCLSLCILSCFRTNHPRIAESTLKEKRKKVRNCVPLENHKVG